MADNNPHRFSSGLEIANLIATSDLLDHSWKAITKLRTVITADESKCLAFFGHYNERSNCKILAFVTTPNCSENPLEEEGGEDLVSLSDLKDEFTAFEFLYSESCSDSAINGAALDLFGRFYPVYEQEAQQQQQRVVDVKRLAMALQGNEMNMIFEKTNPFAKTLNDVKINMAKLEWYKKKCNSESIGYYDSYKNGRTEPDIKVAEFKKILLVYWENKVEEAERKPVKEGSPLNVRLLFGGTNYRRMVEPLDIAEHYRKGLKNYKAHRPKHYRKLEEWYNESMTPESSSTQRESVSSILTVDSLFWAHVEEAVVACQVLRMVDSSAEEKEAELAKLKEFEEYVVELMKNYGVSSEIFLPHSSFMRWWDEYDGIVGDDHDSVLTMLMRNEEYKEYANGRLDIP